MRKKRTFSIPLCQEFWSHTRHRRPACQFACPAPSWLGRSDTFKSTAQRSFGRVSKCLRHNKPVGKGLCLR
jgi:hypothetical protein